MKNEIEINTTKVLTVASQEEELSPKVTSIEKMIEYCNHEEILLLIQSSELEKLNSVPVKAAKIFFRFLTNKTENGLYIMSVLPWKKEAFEFFLDAETRDKILVLKEKNVNNIKEFSELKPTYPVQASVPVPVQASVLKPSSPAQTPAPFQLLVGGIASVQPLSPVLFNNIQPPTPRPITTAYQSSTLPQTPKPQAPPEPQSAPRSPNVQ